VMRPRAAIGQAGSSKLPIPVHPFGCRLGTHAEAYSRGTYPQAVVDHQTGQTLSTDRRPWGILVIVHSVSRVTELLVTTSFSGSNRMDNVLKDHRCPTLLAVFWREGGHEFHSQRQPHALSPVPQVRVHRLDANLGREVPAALTPG
jgi:hypothetical protein